MIVVSTVVGSVARLDEIGEVVAEAGGANPGLASFIAIVLLVFAVLGLLISMVRRLRRVRYREEVREKIAVELAERDGKSPGSDDAGPAAAGGGGADK